MLMIVGRLLGWILIVLALAVLAWDAWLLVGDRMFASETAGAFWFRMSPEGPNTWQAIIQRYVSPSLWDNVVVPVLLWPAPLGLLLLSGVLGFFGAILAVLFRRRRRRRLMS